MFLSLSLSAGLELGGTTHTTEYSLQNTTSFSTTTATMFDPSSDAEFEDTSSEYIYGRWDVRAIFLAVYSTVFFSCFFGKFFFT